MQNAIVATVIYILVNASLTGVAGWLSRRTQRGGKAPRANGRATTATVEPGLGGGGGATL